MRQLVFLFFGIEAFVTSSELLPDAGHTQEGVIDPVVVCYARCKFY